MGRRSHTWPLLFLRSPACEPSPQWDFLCLPNWLPSIHLSWIVYRASHSGSVFTGLQLLLTPRLVWLWNAQCRQGHISSRVCRIWMKLQQGQAERSLRPRALLLLCMAVHGRRLGCSCAQTVILIGSSSPLSPGSPRSTLYEWGNVLEAVF